MLEEKHTVIISCKVIVFQPNLDYKSCEATKDVDR